MCVPVNRHLVLRTLRLETVRIEALFQIAQIVSEGCKELSLPRFSQARFLEA